MATRRLPTVDSDSGVWGSLLNEYLRVAHDETGGLNVVLQTADLATTFPTPDDNQTVIVKNENKIVRWDATGSAWEDLILGGAGGGGTPGGVDTQVQFNDGGVFGGDAGLTFDKTTDNLTVAGSVTISTLTAGSVLFADAGGNVSEANTAFFWDSPNERLGIGTNTPNVKLDVETTDPLDGAEIGSAFIGNHNFANYAQFRNVSAPASNGWAVGSGPSGDTYINCAPGQFINFEYDNGTNLFAKFEDALIDFNTSNIDRDFRIRGLTDNNLFYADATVDRIGIGTNTPSQLLDVAGSVNVSGNLTVGDFTLPSTDGATGQVLKTDGAGNLTWQNESGGVAGAGGSDTQVQFNSAGALEGSSSFVWDNTNHALTVGGTTGGGISTLNGDIKITDNTDSARYLRLERNGTEVGSLNTLNSRLTLSSSNSSDIKIADALNNGIIVKDGGNVGIGTETPDGTLDVQGGSVFLPGPAVAPLDASFGYSQWSAWIDETTDQIKLKAKKTDGTIINQNISSLADPVTTLNSPTVVNDLQDAYTRIWSAGIFYGGDLTDNGNGTVAIAEGEGMMRVSNSDTAELQSVRVLANASLTLTDNSINYIYASYNSGSPQYEVTTGSTGFNGLDKILVWKVARNGTDLYWLDGRGMNVDSTKAQVEMIFETEGFKFVKGGSVVGTSGTRGVTLNSGAAYFGLNKLSHNAFDTSVADTFEYYYRDGAGGWSVLTGQTQIDNLRYDAGTGTLTTASNNKFINHWIYLIFEQTGGQLATLYGQTEHNTLAEAQSEGPPPQVPATIEGLGALVGRAVVKKGNTSLDLIETTLDTIFSPTAVVNHNTISGLQGGAINEYYHLTLADYETVTRAATATQSGYVNTASQTFSGSKSFTDDLIVDTSVLVVDTANDRIGINTATPEFSLDIDGSLRVRSGGALYFGGTGASDNDVILYRGGADNLKTNDTLTIGAYTLPNVDGTLGQVLKTDGSGNLSWQDDAGGSGTGGIGNISEDLTPQLGGDLDVNTWKITSAVNGHVEISPDGSGNVGINTATPNEKLTLDGVFSLDERLGPGATTGYGKLYVDSGDHHLHFVDQSGNNFDVVKNRAAAQFYSSTGGLDLNVAIPVPMPWNVETRKDPGITHDNATNNSRLYVDEVGWYKVSYSVTCENTDSQAKNIKCEARRNGVSTIIPSAAYGFSRNVSDKFITITGTFIFQTTAASEYVEIMASGAGSVGNAYTVANQSWVLIERV